VITPRHIHAVLRNYLGIQTSDPRFNLMCRQRDVRLPESERRHRVPEHLTQYVAASAAWTAPPVISACSWSLTFEQRTDQQP